jgi:hypothetical protein
MGLELVGQWRHHRQAILDLAQAPRTEDAVASPMASSSRMSRSHDLAIGEGRASHASANAIGSCPAACGRAPHDVLEEDVRGPQWDVWRRVVDERRARCASPKSPVLAERIQK